MKLLSGLSSQARQYLLITANYWAFTLTDGALRMLVVLHFHSLGYSPLEIALLFIFYEFFGVVTNLLGGWLGAYLGLNRIMNIGIGLQLIALMMLLVPSSLLTVPLVMLAQALSGIAKDLNKMSAKSTVKLLLPEDAQDRLFRLVALLTGSKNTLKGVGFFLGAALLALLGFQGAIAVMSLGLLSVWLLSLLFQSAPLGKASYKPKFSDLFSKSSAVNGLSAARFFLFGARDVWFVVALPIHLSSVFGWSTMQVGSFLALWIIAYGTVQILAPRITGSNGEKVPDGRSAFWWAVGLTIIPALMAMAGGVSSDATSASLFQNDLAQETLILGLLAFGAVFAVNSSLHSYLIVRYAAADGVSLDVGFYYMANALGRLAGTVLSGWLYQAYGFSICLLVSAGLVAAAALFSLALPRRPSKAAI